MKILVLGGTKEAKTIVEALHSQGLTVVYSLAGVTSAPSPSAGYGTRNGGFGGVDGLVSYLQVQAIDQVVDATHPYAARISQHALQATRQCQVPLYTYQRAAWAPEPGDHWVMAHDWEDIVHKLQAYRRPLFTLGLQPLEKAEDRWADQVWFVRTLPSPDRHPAEGPQLRRIMDQGPFRLSAERALFNEIQPDVLVSKNSGGASVHNKIRVARERGIFVIMLARPPQPKTSGSYTSINTLLDALMG